MSVTYIISSFFENIGIDNVDLDPEYVSKTRDMVCVYVFLHL